MGFVEFQFANKYVQLIMLFVAYGIISAVVFIGCFMCDKFFRTTFKKYMNIILSIVKRKKN